VKKPGSRKARETKCRSKFVKDHATYIGAIIGALLESFQVYELTEVRHNVKFEKNKVLIHREVRLENEYFHT